MSEQKSLEQIIMEAIDFCTHTRCKKCEYYGKDSTYEHNGKCRGRMMAGHLRKNGVVVREKGEWDDSGRYKFANGGKAIRCPFCGACINEEEYDLYVWNFCPYCGSDMRGEQ